MRWLSEVSPRPAEVVRWELTSRCYSVIMSMLDELILDRIEFVVRRSIDKVLNNSAVHEEQFHSAFSPLRNRRCGRWDGTNIVNDHNGSSSEIIELDRDSSMLWHIPDLHNDPMKRSFRSRSDGLSLLRHRFPRKSPYRSGSLTLTGQMKFRCTIDWLSTLSSHWTSKMKKANKECHMFRSIRFERDHHLLWIIFSGEERREKRGSFNFNDIYCSPFSSLIAVRTSEQIKSFNHDEGDGQSLLLFSSSCPDRGVNHPLITHLTAPTDVVVATGSTSCSFSCFASSLNDTWQMHEQLIIWNRNEFLFV